MGKSPFHSLIHSKLCTFFRMLDIFLNDFEISLDQSSLHFGVPAMGRQFFILIYKTENIGFIFKYRESFEKPHFKGFIFSAD
jgi:hypothetical protein